MERKNGRVRVRKMTDEFLAVQLQKYEKKYAMSSAEFFEKYQRGEMGDSEEVVAWAAYHQMSLVPAGEDTRVKT